MRHADANSPVSGSGIDNEVQEIINATASNKRIFGWQDFEEAEYTTSSLRYTSENRPRPEYRSKDDLPDSLRTDGLTAPLRLFGHENSFLQFQVEAWNEIKSQYVKAKQTGLDQGAVVTAPTGFGKTNAFLGEILKKILLGDPDSALFIYPSRALLQDHLQRILEIQHRLRTNSYPEEENDYVRRLFNNNFSVGVAMGRQPYTSDNVLNDGKSYVDNEGPNDVLKISDYWDDDVSDTNLYIKESGSDSYKTVSGHQPGNRIELDSEELTLHRKGIKNDQPNITLTTLESLEILAMKPHYDTVEQTDFFVFDEIHEYTGLRGSHAAEIIKNTRKIRKKEVDNDPAVFIGASATVDSPTEFGETLFAFDQDLSEPIPTGPNKDTSLDQFIGGSEDQQGVEDSNTVSTIQPHKTDFDKENQDKLNYYFLLSPKEGPGAASQYIQHAMMIGHALSQPDPKKEGDQNWQKQLAFIDSIGHINRLKVQFEDADKRRNLWKLHKDKPEYNWQDLAIDTDHKFINRSLNSPVSIYSGSDTSVDELRSAEHILGTKFLEIGIDIDNLKYISQYRPPRDIKSFKQRAGRAAREKGNDGHVFTHLSRFAGDGNFHYRAERFLDSDIRTPITTDNDVVSWIHSKFYSFYKVAYSYNADQPYTWLDEENEKDVLEDYFKDSLQYDIFYDFLVNTNEFFRSHLDLSVGNKTLLTNRISPTMNSLSGESTKINNQLSEIQKAIPADVDSILLKESPNQGISDEIRGRASNLASMLSQAAESLGRAEEIPINLSEIIEQLDSGFDKTDRTIEENIEELQEISNKLGEAWFKINRMVELADDEHSIPPKHEIDELHEASKALKKAFIEGELSEYGKRRKEIYFAKEAVSLVDEYYGRPARQGSLYAIKYLLQAAYYLNQALAVRRDQEDVGFHLSSSLPKDTEFWYIPPNYFSDSGRYFTLEKCEAVDENNRIEEKSVDSILSQYSPLKGEYVEEGVIQTFQPKMKVKNGEPKIDFSEIPGPKFDLTGEGDPLIMPNKIQLRKVPDKTGSEARQVVPFDTDTLEILSEEKESSRPEDRVDHGKVHARPQIQTDISNPESVDESRTGKLRLGQMDTQAWIESVKVNIQPYTEKRPGKFTSNGDEDANEVKVERDGPRLGYTMNTRGLVWELDDFLNSIDEETYAEARKFKDFDKVEPQEAALVTASHYLKLLVADITGIDSEVLHYGYNTTRDEVYVFEEVEGGQGIVDLFYDDLHNNPSASINSVYRLLHNPQVFNERIWASSADLINAEIDFSDLDEKEGREEAKRTLQEIIRDQTGVTYSESLSRIAEEILATIQRARSASDQYDIDVVSFLNLKQEYANERLDGNERPSRGVETRHSELFDEVQKETLEDLFFSPDIDSCEANLQLPTTATELPQDRYLSDVLLTALEEYVLESVPKEQRKEAIQERQRYWGRVDDDELIYLRW